MIRNAPRRAAYRPLNSLFSGLPTRRGRPYDRARMQLAYGELLRRSQRRVDARTHLRLALEVFEDLHAEPLIARATQEL
ncbi:MAG: hypothetical protein ACRDTD_12495, partial [Pseudonocardiaceae bacterium]